MTEKKDSGLEGIDPSELNRSMSEIAGRSQQLVKDFLARQEAGQQVSMDDALHMSKLFQDLYARLMADPVQLMQAQMAFWQDYMSIMQNSTLRMMGVESEPVRQPEKRDKRFAHEGWEDNPFFDFVKQSYLLTADYLHRTVDNVDGLDDRTRRKIDFYTRQFVSAMSPSNFLATNPEVLERTVETRGQNLMDGLNKLLEDLERGNGTLKIRQTNPDAFEVGKDLAITPGKVVYQNELMQLIQYAPATEQVARRPLLFVPPWINKYYILDLRPKNSLVKWLVEQGFTVFVISWCNPSAKLANKRFEDYMTDGPLAALDAIEQAIGERDVNIIGYCLGGTLLASTLAYMAERGESGINSATFLTTLLDFENPGELEIFIDEEQLAALEKQMDQRGYLQGNQMATTMSSLRSNDLIWSFFVNNYLKGEDPFPFDLLLLEPGFHQHAGADACVLPAQDVPGKSAPAARGHHHGGGPHRPVEKRGADLLRVSPGGSHCALACLLPRLEAARGQIPVRTGWIRPYCRGDQPAGEAEVRLLDQHPAAEGSGCLAGRGDPLRRLLVAGLGELAAAETRWRGARPAAGGWQSAAH